MRILLFLIIAGLIGVAILWALPQNGPEKKIAKITNYPQEVVDNNIRDVTPEDTLPGPELDHSRISRLPAKPLPPQPKSPLKPVILSNVLIPMAGIIIKDKLRIELTGIKATNIDKICQTPNQAQWPCGRFARTAMRQYIRARKLNCIDTKKVSDANKVQTIRTQCKIAGKDIAQWLVLQGWAMPEGDIHARLHALAKSNNRGFWRLTPP